MTVLPISVVIAAKNAEETIEACLDSIRRNNPAEIIVVDGNSSDRTVEIARGYTERIYSDGGKGHSYASQLGTEQATQEYVAYVDSDVILTDGALSTMLAEFEGSGLTVISAQELLPVRPLNYWEWAAYQRGQYSKSRRREAYLGMLACLFKRETMLRYGFDLFDRYLHDFDLEMRLRKSGHEFGVSSATIYHDHRYDLRSFINWQVFLGKANAHHIRKWGPWHIRFWPPLYTPYWLGFCLVKRNLRLVPYVVAHGTVQTVGMMVGFLELMGSAVRGR